jgi:hypothetical protein
VVNGPDARETAALRRVAAQTTAEAAELPDNTWLEIGRGRLRGRVPVLRRTAPQRSRLSVTQAVREMGRVGLEPTTMGLKGLRAEYR